MARPLKTIIEYRYYELPLEFPLLFLDGSRWYISDVKSDVLHFHNCLEIGLCHSDSGTMIFEDMPLEFRAGDVTCVPRHIPHTTYSSPGKNSLWSYLFVNLNDLLTETFHALGGFDNFASLELSRRNFKYLISKDENPRVNFLANALVSELRGKKPDYQSVVRAMLLTLYYELLRVQDAAAIESEPLESSSSSGDKLVIKPALNYIYANYMQDFSIEYLADLCHLSATHFRRVFLSIMGTPPLSYINATRIEKACLLLHSTDDPILAVSEQVGFRTVSSFNRSFLQIMGISPRDYRNPATRQNAKPERKAILKFSGWM